jgi:signal transduction histidine kinase
LSFFFVSSAQSARNESFIISSAQSAATSIVFTQRESLAYSTKFSLWLAGLLPRRDVEIARALLAQRLNVATEDGTTTGERAEPEYLLALQTSDRILAQAPSGLMPLSFHNKISKESEAFISEMLVQSRAMVVTYQQELDRNIVLAAQNRSKNYLISLVLLILLILLTTVAIIWGGISFNRQYKIARKNIEIASATLAISVSKLKSAENTVKSLEELNAKKNDFISTVNHELRTPLTSIIGYTDLLKSLELNKKPEEFKKIAAVIERNSSVLRDIIDSILSLSNFDSSEQATEFEKVFLPEIIEKKVYILTPTINEKSLSLNCHFPAGIDFAISGNSGQISQVIINLLSNAIKFSPDSARIDISLSLITRNRSDDYIRLIIKDEGMGIPKEDIPKLFTRFFRASNAVSGQIQGTGLGLAIVSRILEIHKAFIKVESTPGVGSSFIIDFPRFISEIDRHVSTNRINVLHKAIVAIRESPRQELIQVCHQMSGAVGFYSLELEMNLISQMQQWLEANPEATLEEIDLKKDQLVLHLEETYSALIAETEKVI